MRKATEAEKAEEGSKEFVCPKDDGESAWESGSKEGLMAEDLGREIVASNAGETVNLLEFE
jgi:hypothetical protein